MPEQDERDSIERGDDAATADHGEMQRLHTVARVDHLLEQLAAEQAHAGIQSVIAALRGNFTEGGNFDYAVAHHEPMAEISQGTSLDAQSGDGLEALTAILNKFSAQISVDEYAHVTGGAAPSESEDLMIEAPDDLFTIQRGLPLVGVNEVAQQPEGAFRVADSEDSRPSAIILRTDLPGVRLIFHSDSQSRTAFKPGLLINTGFEAAAQPASAEVEQQPGLDQEQLASARNRVKGDLGRALDALPQDEDHRLGRDIIKNLHDRVDAALQDGLETGDVALVMQHTDLLPNETQADNRALVALLTQLGAFMSEPNASSSKPFAIRDAAALDNLHDYMTQYTEDQAADHEGESFAVLSDEPDPDAQRKVKELRLQTNTPGVILALGLRHVGNSVREVQPYLRITTPGNQETPR